jgi:hypothetical protein
LVPDRLLVDIDRDGRAQVSAWLEGELPAPVGDPVELEWSLTADELEDLRWYLEDYLRAPFGVYEDRGPLIAAQLPEWGQRIFNGLFGLSSARDAYVAIRTRAALGGRPELVVRSEHAGWMALPWELISDPAVSAPVVLDALTVSRSLPAGAVGQGFAVGGERLRVLMVISRPRGAGDVGYRMIARPLLQRLEAVRGQVDLVVLRPPRLERLREVLAGAQAVGEPFQVVHFDGHGVLAGARAAGPGAPWSYAGDGEGTLVFEQPGGGSDPVVASEVARVLAGGRVPVVVLNACQSGALGKELESAVAILLDLGFGPAWLAGQIEVVLFFGVQLTQAGGEPLLDAD